jgi:16S rRNA (adenine1518-N6/adenine1519-N6)-dimethyltransferase
MSGVIRLTRKETPVAVRSEKAFFTLVKAAFGQRRKMLRNPMKPFFEAAVLQEEIFTKRAEQLTVEQFAELTFKMG